MTDNDEVLDSAKRRADEIKARGEASAENLTPEQKILRDEILNKSSGSVATTPEHHKAIFAAEWGEKTPAEQLELAYAMFCAVAKRDKQMAGRINEGNAEFWALKNKDNESDRALVKGRAIAAATRAAKADGRKNDIQQFVRALYERPQDPLGPSGCTVFDLSVPQLVRFTKERIDTHGYKDTTLEKIVGGVVAEQKRARRKRADVLWPD